MMKRILRQLQESEVKILEWLDKHAIDPSKEIHPRVKAYIDEIEVFQYPG